MFTWNNSIAAQIAMIEPENKIAMVGWYTSVKLFINLKEFPRNFIFPIQIFVHLFMKLKWLYSSLNCLIRQCMATSSISRSRMDRSDLFAFVRSLIECISAIMSSRNESANMITPKANVKKHARYRLTKNIVINWMLVANKNPNGLL